jgi:hypothetical protein
MRLFLPSAFCYGLAYVLSWATAGSCGDDACAYFIAEGTAWTTEWRPGPGPGQHTEANCWDWARSNDRATQQLRAPSYISHQPRRQGQRAAGRSNDSNAATERAGSWILIVWMRCTHSLRVVVVARGACAPRASRGTLAYTHTSASTGAAQVAAGRAPRATRSRGAGARARGRAIRHARGRRPGRCCCCRAARWLGSCNDETSL